MDTLKTGIFPQRVTERYPLDGKVYSLAVGDDVIYLCTSEGLVKLSDDTIKKLSSDLIFTTVHICKDGRVLAGCDNKLYLIGDKGAEPFAEFNHPVTDIKDSDKLYILTRRVLYVEREDGFYHLSNCEQDAECLAILGEKVCASNNRWLFDALCGI